MDFAGQRLLRNVTDSDALTRSAVDRYLNPNGTPLVARPGILPNVVSGAGSLFTGAPTPTPLWLASPPSALRAVVPAKAPNLVPMLFAKGVYARVNGNRGHVKVEMLFQAQGRELLMLAVPRSSGALVRHLQGSGGRLYTTSGGGADFVGGCGKATVGCGGDYLGSAHVFNVKAMSSMLTTFAVPAWLH